MPELVKLDGNLSGYDTLIRSGEDFIALQGEGVPELHKDMKVMLLGDTRGYVPSGFKPGEEVTIVGFREAYKEGETTDIVCVTNGRNTGWVKLSNIQRALVEPGPADPVYKGIRQHLSRAFAEFTDTVYLHMADAERKNLPLETGPFVNAIVSYALKRLPKFGEQLAETIARKYEENPDGERFIQDPLRSLVANSCLFLDKDGQIVSVKNPEIVWSASSPRYLYIKRYESYEVLTGPLVGKRFYPNTRQLGNPVYRPGLVAKSMNKVSSSGNAPVPSWFPVAAVIFTAFTALSLLYLIIRHEDIATGKRVIFDVWVAFCTAASVSFIGGTAQAQGRLPWLGDSPIKFSAFGGIGVFVVALIIMYNIYH